MPQKHGHFPSALTPNKCAPVPLCERISQIGKSATNLLLLLLFSRSMSVARQLPISVENGICVILAATLFFPSSYLLTLQADKGSLALGISSPLGQGAACFPQDQCEVRRTHSRVPLLGPGNLIPSHALSHYVAHGEDRSPSAAKSSQVSFTNTDPPWEPESTQKGKERMRL